jgi:hypothetical protein
MFFGQISVCTNISYSYLCYCDERAQNRVKMWDPTQLHCDKRVESPHVNIWYKQIIITSSLRKVGPMKQSMKAPNKDADCFNFICSNFKCSHVKKLRISHWTSEQVVDFRLNGLKEQWDLLKRNVVDLKQLFNVNLKAYFLHSQLKCSVMLSVSKTLHHKVTTDAFSLQDTKLSRFISHHPDF